MIVALLDDGIDLRRCPGFSVTHDLIVEKDGVIRPRSAGETVLTDHGTTCAQIIHAYAPEAEFCSLGIFQRPKLTTGLPQLLAALKWCLEMQIPLIHMSIGSTQLCDDGPIRQLIAQLQRQGQVVIAAHSNKRSRYTMPACYSGVLGVSADAELSGKQFYVTEPAPNDVQIFASAKHDLSAYPSNLSTTELPTSNSYAAPVITAEVHNILCQSSSRLSIPALLHRLAGRPVSGASMRPDFLTSAIVYDPAQMLKVAYADFQVLNIFPNEGSLFSAMEKDPNSPVLLMPPCSFNRHFADALFLRSKQRAGIVYAGMLPSALQDTAPCLFWSEDSLHTLSDQLHELPLPEDIPVMQVEPCGDAALKLLCHLKTRLTADGYGCTAISDFPKAYLYGLDYVAGTNRTDSLVAHLCYAKRPDVVLSSLNDSNAHLPCEMRVTFSSCIAAIIQKDTAMLPLDPSIADMDALYVSLFDD